MYFYRQLAKQFFQNLYIGFGPDEVRSQLATEKKEPNGDTLSEGVLANLSPEQRKLAGEIQEQIAELQKQYKTEAAGEKINGAGAKNIESSLTDEDKKDPEAQSLLSRLEMYKRRFTEATEAKEDVSLRLSALNSELTHLGEAQGEIDISNIGDITEKQYTVEDANKLQESIDTSTQEIREAFFTFIGEADTGKLLGDYKDNEKLKLLTQAEKDGLIVGYNIEDVLTDFDSNISKDIPKEPLQEQAELLEVQAEQIKDIQQRLNIILRDTKKIDGEETLGEKRVDSAHESYNELLKDEKLKELLTNSQGDIPEFEDLHIGHIDALQDAGYDIKKLFLLTPDGKPFAGGKIEQGKEYIVNLSINEDLNNTLPLSYIDPNLGKVEIDGEIAEFKDTDVVKPGYYNSKGVLVDIRDGSVLKPLSPESKASEETIKAITEDRKLSAEQATAFETYARSVYQNPDAPLNVKALPKGLEGMILAFLAKIFTGEDYQFNSETGQYELAGSGEAITNGQYIENYTGDSLELGALSARYESSSKGPYAYNGNDNGHGPSYGTYQMNTNKGIYRPFARKHGIAAGQAGWNAAIEKAGGPKEFAKLEHDFVKQMNYDPMISSISVAGKDKFSPAMQNVIWSIAVQHGPGNKTLLGIINKSGVTPGDMQSEAKLINALYDARGRIWPSGIRSRYNNERGQALAMLQMSQGGDIYAQNVDTSQFPSFISAPDYINSTTKVTQCSRTARENLQKLGIRNVKQGRSALKSFRMYESSKIDRGFPSAGSDKKVADVYLDASPKNRQFGHRVTAIQKEGKWFIYDPYYAIPGYESNRRGPIPAEAYISHMTQAKGRKFWGAAYLA